MCSEKLTRILQSEAHTTDGLQWLAVSVRKQRDECLYYILHFPDPPDVLDKQRSILAGDDFVVKPVFSRQLVLCHAVFAYPRNEGVALFVSEHVMRALQIAKCTGMEFQRVTVT
jgi:hypothetical protein